MSAPVQQETPPSISSKLGVACVQLRPDLEVSRHVFRDEVSYIISDPLTFQSHRFSAADYRIVISLRTDRTLADVFEQLVGADHLATEDEERFYQFVFSLHRLGFLKLPIADDKTLFKRHLAKKQAKRSQRWTSIFFCRIPVINPDDFLNRTMRFVRPIFSRPVFVLWLALMALAAYAGLSNWAEFSEPVTNIFSGRNLLPLWATLIALKIAHEYGHAYACKNFGGHVPEMGVYLIVFTPCAYVDATASWGFSRKRDRVIVCLAGMYIELAIAAMAMILWTMTPPGVLRSILHNVVILSSIVTVAFNINPLMRYDGYYALSDLIEVPNLRQRSNSFATLVLKRLTLGVPITGAWGSPGHRVFLFVFGACSAVYKVILVLGISALIAMKFLAAGLFLGGTYVINELVRVLKRMIPYLWRSPEAAPVRVRAIGLSLLLMLGLPLAVMGIPVPDWTLAHGVVVGENDAVLRADSSGFLRDLGVEIGQEVSAGKLVAELEEPEAEAQLEGVRARLDAALIRHAALEPGHANEASQEWERVLQLERELEHRCTQLGRAQITAPMDGTVIECLEHTELGRYVHAGEPVAMLSQGKAVVRALLTEENVASARPAIGQRVEFRTHAAPDVVLKGTIQRITAAGRRELSTPLLDHLDLEKLAVNPMTKETVRSHFELEVLLDATPGHLAGPLHGMTGRLRLPGRTEPVARVLVRKFLLFANRLRG